MKDNIVKTCLLPLVACLLFLVAAVAFAVTDIDSTYRYAWNDVIGWIDFYSTGTVYIHDDGDKIEGYAYSPSIGFISLNCITTPNGDICSGPAGHWKVANDGSGNLSGWAWNDVIGWISFDSYTVGSPFTYQVVINPVTGDFSGWAWNDVIGWISFNCANPGTAGCNPGSGGSDYKVKTNWGALPLGGNLTSSIFDTQVASGTAINTIMWQGSKPSGTNVKFQIASSNSPSGSWTYRGPDGTNNTYYAPANSNIPVQINLLYHNNHRYFRYKVFLESDSGRTQSPIVNDIIINWSP